MSSRQEEEEEEQQQQQPGPSGVPPKEVLALLGLDMSEDKEEEHENLVGPEVMNDIQADLACNEVMGRFERQRAFQTQLLQQSGGGGGLDPQTQWEPLNLISIPLWINAVLPWGSANVISIPDYVKRVISWTVLT